MAEKLKCKKVCSCSPKGNALQYLASQYSGPEGAKRCGSCGQFRLPYELYQVRVWMHKYYHPGVEHTLVSPPPTKLYESPIKLLAKDLPF